MARPGEGAGLVDLISSGLSVDSLPDLARWKAVGADPDAVPGAPEHQIVRPGDVWTLGDHRLACGDSTDVRCVAALLAGAQPHLMVTDPPYGVNYDPGWRNEAARNGAIAGRTREVIGARAVGKVINDDRSDWRAAWRLFPGDVAYIWHAGRYASSVQTSLEAAGFNVRSQIIWAKSRFVIGRGNYHWQHEPCWYAVRDGATAHWSGGHSQTTVWEIHHVSSDTGHGTQKPVECMRRPILNNSVPGDAVYEPFCGSGTTIIAAEMEGRCCYALELNPLYVYISILRWQDFTGKTASLDGEPFGDVLARRSLEKDPEPEPDDATPPVPSSDPVLAELVYRWYPPRGGTVVDPYPDPVRGAVARAMGTYAPDGDGTLLMCPDLAGLSGPRWYPDFLGRFLADVRRLAPRPMACVVARDRRWDDGNWCGFPGHAAEAFADASMRLGASHALALPEGRTDLLVFIGK